MTSPSGCTEHNSVIETLTTELLVLRRKLDDERRDSEQLRSKLLGHICDTSGASAEFSGTTYPSSTQLRDLQLALPFPRT